MTLEQLSALAQQSGATHFSPPPMRAVRGWSFTHDQLAAFADTLAAQPAAEPGWWRKRADEIELQVAQGQSDAMRCYTDMRALLQAVAEPAAEPVARMSVGDARNAIRHPLIHDGYVAGWNAALEAVASRSAAQPARTGGDAPFDEDACRERCDVCWGGPDQPWPCARKRAHESVARKRAAALAAAPQPAMTDEELAEKLADANCEPGTAAWRYCGRTEQAEWIVVAKAARALLAPAAPPPAPAEQQEWPKLTKRSRVGNGTFGVGVSSRLVVEAAQRHEEQRQAEAVKTPEQLREDERNRRKLWDMIHGPVEPKPAASPTVAPIQRAREGTCIHGKGFQCVTCWPHPAAPSDAVEAQDRSPRPNTSVVLGQGDLAAANVFQSVAVAAAQADEEEAPFVDLGRDGAKHHLQAAGSALPHDASPVMRADDGTMALQLDDSPHPSAPAGEREPGDARGGNGKGLER